MIGAKLVRDRIPEVIRAAGGSPVIRAAEPAELPGLLRAKLTEEVGEFLESGSAEELADILEVVYALAGQLGMSEDALDALRERKAAARGRFTAGIVWHGPASQ